jgi:hypothetical protein
MTRVVSFLRAIAQHIAEGCPHLAEDSLRKRFATCEPCQFRSGNTCGDCGCVIAIKARMPSQQCPRGLWPVD